MTNIKKLFREYGLIAMGVLLFFVNFYFFVYGADILPSTTPPQNNVPPPITTSTTTQTKNGVLVVNTLATLNKVKSNRYCDALGVNCDTGTTTVSSTTILYGEASPTFAGPADRKSIGATATFTVAFSPVFTKMPVIHLVPKDFVVATNTHFCDPISVQKNHSSMTVFFRVYDWNGICTIPTKLDWMAAGEG